MNNFIIINNPIISSIEIIIDEKNYNKILELIELNTKNTVQSIIIKKFKNNIPLNNNIINNKIKEKLSEYLYYKNINASLEYFNIEMNNNKLISIKSTFKFKDFDEIIKIIKNAILKNIANKDIQKISTNFIDELKFSIPENIKPIFIENIVKNSKNEICNIISQFTNEKGKKITVKNIIIKNN